MEGKNGNWIVNNIANTEISNLSNAGFLSSAIVILNADDVIF